MTPSLDGSGDYNQNDARDRLVDDMVTRRDHVKKQLQRDLFLFFLTMLILLAVLLTFLHCWPAGRCL